MSVSRLPLARARAGALLALLAALLCALPVGAQTWIRAEPDASARAVALAHSPGGLVAVLEDVAGATRVMLLDSSGNHLRTLQLFTSGGEQPSVRALIFVDDDALLLAGAHEEHPWTARVAVSDGSVAWARKLTLTEKGVLEAITLNDEGHAVGFGYMYGASGITDSILVAVSASTGGLHYRRRWPAGRATTLTSLENGDLLIAQAGKLTRTTVWGHPVWRKNMVADSDLDQVRVVETPDGDLMAVGVLSHSPFEFELAVWRLAPDGTPRFARSIETYASSLTSQEVAVAAAAPTADGGLVAAVSQPSPADGLTASGVLRVDADGNVLWLRMLGTLGHVDGAVGVAVTPGDGVVVALDDVDGGMAAARLDAQGQSASCPVGSLGILGQQPFTLAVQNESFLVGHVTELFQSTSHFPLVIPRTLTEVCSSSCSVSGASYGVGTAGSDGFVPQLHANDGPCSGATPTIDVSGALGGAPGLIFLGFGPANLPGLGGTFLVNPTPMKIFNLQLGGAPGVPGAGGLSIPTGGDLASVQGITVYLQAVFADPAAPTGKTLTNGVSVRVD